MKITKEIKTVKNDYLLRFLVACMTHDNIQRTQQNSQCINVYIYAITK